MIDKDVVNQLNHKAAKLGIGTNKVGGHNLFDGLRDQDGYDLVKEALDSNIQMIDTAFMYGLGRSEEIIGDVLQNYPRENFKIATKAAQDPNNDLKINNTPAFLTQAVDDALTRLKTDYIDLFYIHFPDDDTPKDEAVDALTKLKQAGKIKAVGVSNFSLEQIKEANKDGGVDFVEDHYNLVDREAETKLWPYLKENNIQFVPYFPLASGLLTGKYQPEDSSKFKQFSADQFHKIMTGIDVVKQIASSHQATVAQTVLAWYIKNPDIAVVIPGARQPQQVADNAATLKVGLSDDDYQTIDRVFSGI
ncbi:aldo/keto reductase [Leuconostoc falkenbergense]|uniref:Aldo/keto reductase n=1 Tax=Leuconostoc falkenbergense TaxID=2766470 RepID=A0ABT7S1N2_9LACO|nr:aldo/keto reductase [Leuconostoc falkenbergense]MDM7647456.1 aldo/keto reductase [Leuconostoc falkenbergense]MDY5164518.1 aldo/keto reductase [Leuconostoc falkenbergense]HCU42096.1 oxidoreductase [Leuconostoc pseudomesenteroides]